jgi:5-methyltetrahydrofolate--homocysteine methyltransferase
MREACPDLPILVHANAGLPQLVDGKSVFPDSPAAMAKQVGKLIEAGANIIGGCCGTTPAHIKAITEAVDEHTKA